MKRLLFCILAIGLNDFAAATAATQDSTKQFETSVNIAVFPDTEWTQELVNKEVDVAQTILAQCNIRIADARIYEISDYRLPQEMNGREHYAENGAVAVRTATMQVPQPAVYLVGEMSNSSGFTKAVMRVNAPPCEPELENTIWLPQKVTHPEYQEGRHTTPFGTLAHEMTHLLTLEGMHNGDLPRNQLSIWRFRTDLLTEEMCREMRESPFVRQVQ